PPMYHCLTPCKSLYDKSLMLLKHAKLLCRFAIPPSEHSRSMTCLRTLRKKFSKRSKTKQANSLISLKALGAKLTTWALAQSAKPKKPPKVYTASTPKQVHKS